VTTIYRIIFPPIFCEGVGLGRFFHNEEQPSNSEPGSRISVGDCQQVCHWVCDVQLDFGCSKFPTSIY
jgi:hypothetical protein